MSTTPQALNDCENPGRAGEIALPPSTVSETQDREWCVVEVNGRWRKIRFHDYDEIYAIPGLYETLFYDVLRCSSPTKVRDMLGGCIRDARVAPGRLRVLDLGAGNGMVGEELTQLGVRHVVGVDIISAAAEAAERDRQNVYHDYLVCDMTDLSEREHERLSSFGFNCLACVAALGFGDIPPAAFANAFNLIERGGWVTFNIKSDFLTPEKGAGFAGLIRRMIDTERISVRARQQYPHRLATNGEPLQYTAFVAVKNADVPAGWID